MSQTAISINGEFLDLTPNFRIALNYEGVQEAGKVAGSGSNTISIPLTERNKRILGDIYDLDTVLETTLAFGDTINCTLHYEGNEFLQGVLVITRWDDLSVKCQFLSTAANWAESLDRKLKDVNQGVGGSLENRWQVVYNVCDWLTSVDRSGRVSDTLFETHTWLPTAYGFLTGFIGANDPNQGIAFNTQRPAAFVYPLLVAHFEQAGYRLRSQFLEDISNLQRDDVLPLALPQVTDVVFSGEIDFETATETPLAKVDLTVDSTPPACALLSTGANFDNVVSDPAGVVSVINLDPCSIFPSRNNLPEYTNANLISITRPGFYRLQGTIITNQNDVEIRTSTLFAAVPTLNQFNPSRFNIQDRLVSGQGLIDETLFVGESRDFDFIFEVKNEDLFAGGTLHLQMQVFGTLAGIIAAGSSMALSVFDQLQENDTYDIRDTLPDVTALDLWSAIVKAFNLKVYTDEINKVVFAEPLDEFYDLSQLHDLSPQINRAAPFKQERISENKSGLLLLWAKDEDDAIHEVYEHPQQNLTDTELPLGSRIVLADKGNAIDTVKIEDFAGTFNDYLLNFEGQDIGGIHVLWLRVNEEEPFLRFTWLPRIVQVQAFQANQNLYIRSQEPVDGTCSGSFTSVASGSEFVTEFFRYPRGFFGGDLPNDTQNGQLPQTSNNFQLSFYSETGQDSYTRFYESERLQDNLLRKITAQLMLNKGRTIEEFIRYNLYWQLDNQIVRIDRISKHNVGTSNLVEADFTVIKSLPLPQGEAEELPLYFIGNWDATNGLDATAFYDLLRSDGGDIIVNWGDGNETLFTGGISNDTSVQHTYGFAGIYDIGIRLPDAILLSEIEIRGQQFLDRRRNYWLGELDLSVFTRLERFVYDSAFNNTANDAQQITSFAFASDGTTHLDEFVINPIAALTDIDLSGASMLGGVVEIGTPNNLLGMPNLNPVSWPTVVSSSATNITSFIFAGAGKAATNYDFTPLEHIGGTINIRFSRGDTYTFGTPRAGTNNITSFQAIFVSIDTIDVSALDSLGGNIAAVGLGNQITSPFVVFDLPATLRAGTAPITNVDVGFLAGNYSNLTTLDLSGLTTFDNGRIDARFNDITTFAFPASAGRLTELDLSVNQIGYVAGLANFTNSDGVIVDLRDNSFTAAETNQWLDAFDTTGWINGTIDISGAFQPNAAPDTTSGGVDGVAAVANLVSNGWTVVTN